MYVCMYVCGPLSTCRVVPVFHTRFGLAKMVDSNTLNNDIHTHTCPIYMPIHSFQDARTHLGPCSSQLELETARKYAVLG